MTEKLGQALAPPPNLKQQILLHSRLCRRQPWWRTWQTATAAAAALLLLTLGVWHFTRVPTGPSEAMALAAMQQTKQMAAIQFVSRDAAEVASWVNEQPLARTLGLQITKPVADMRLIGSSVTELQGKPAIVLCLQNGRKLAHVYVFRAEDLQIEDTTRVFERHGAVAKVVRIGQHACVLTTRGTSADLDFDLPL